MAVVETEWFPGLGVGKTGIVLPTGFFDVSPGLPPDLIRKIQAETLFRLRYQPRPEEFAELDSPRTQNDRVARELLQTLEDRVLYEDPYLFIINKPAGVASHWGDNIKFGVEEIVRDQRGINMQLVNRLDSPTSGAIVFAKDFDTHVRLSDQFANKEQSGVKKVYLALLDGEFAQEGRQEVAVGLRPGKGYLMQAVPYETMDGFDPEVMSTLTYFEPLMLLQTDGKKPKRKTLTAVQIVTGKNIKSGQLLHKY